MYTRDCKYTDHVLRQRAVCSKLVLTCSGQIVQGSRERIELAKLVNHLSLSDTLDSRATPAQELLHR